MPIAAIARKRQFQEDRLAKFSRISAICATVRNCRFPMHGFLGGAEGTKEEESTEPGTCRDRRGRLLTRRASALRPPENAAKPIGQLRLDATFHAAIYPERGIEGSAIPSKSIPLGPR